MKRQLLMVLLALICALCLAFGLAGCTPDNGDNGQNSTDQGDQNQPDDGKTDDETENGLSYYLSNSSEYYVIGIGNVTENDIIIPDTYKELPVTTIYNNAFANRKNITSVTIPDSVTYIGESAFSGCTNLVSVNIPDNVTYVGKNAFSNCAKLFIFAGAESTPDDWDSRWNLLPCPVIWNYGGEHGITDSGFTWGSHKDGTAAVAGYTGSETDIEIPVKVKSYNVSEITAYTFSSNSSLKSVTVPDSVTSIGERAFNSCTGLENITLSDNSKLTAIGERAFNNCTSLAPFTIPDSLTTIGAYAFYRCTNLTDFNPGDNSNLTTIGERAFYNCTSLASFTIPDCVTTIGAYAFSNCTNLTDITIGSGAPFIDNSAFLNCTNIDKLNIKNINSWFDISFGDEYSSPLYYVSNLYVNGEHITELEIPDGVTSLGDSTLNNCKCLVGIIIPKRVTTIAANAFKGSNFSIFTPVESKPIGWADNWNSLLPIVWSYTGKNGITEDGIIWTILKDGSMAVAGYFGSETEIVVPDKINDKEVTSIVEFAFSPQTNVTSITLPDTITTICQYAFYGCPNLQDLTVPKGVTTIESYAFAGSGFRSITIHKDVKMICPYAFVDCTNLTSVNSEDTTTSWRLYKPDGTSSGFTLLNRRSANYLTSLYASYRWVKTDD